MESGEGNGKKGKWDKRWKEGDWGDLDRGPPGRLGHNLSTLTHDVSEGKIINNCSSIRSYMSFIYLLSCVWQNLLAIFGFSDRRRAIYAIPSMVEVASYSIFRRLCCHLLYTMTRNSLRRCTL